MIATSEPVTAVVAVIDDDKGIREALDGMLRSVGLQVECFASAQEFLAKDDRDKFGCIVLDVHLPGRNGLDFLDDLAALHVTTPVIVISGFADVPMSVRAMKAGAIEFLTKPVRAMDLLAAVEAAVKRDRVTKQAAEKIAGLKADFDTLTVREREVFAYVAAGLMNKQIAAALDLSEATIKLYRGTMMRKMRANSLADIVRMADQLGYEPPSLA
ncbi:response regulator transcription factor [Tardiphaga sp. 803_E3_N1_3]|uniref:response regulator transcription factor n=1 Tax=Tardiphaga sp. 803_E3_N1_3 TaxID=3240785 RepID=UPI003F228FB0